MAENRNYVKLEFFSKDCNVAVARLAAASFSAELGFSLTDIEEIKVAVSEGVSNAMIHGYGGDETRIVEMTLSVCGDFFEITVKDDGVGIDDVQKAMEPTYSTIADRMGLGFVFMDSFMDSLDVQSAPQCGTLVRMQKRCPCL